MIFVEINRSLCCPARGRNPQMVRSRW